MRHSLCHFLYKIWHSLHYFLICLFP
jgi:hypothetical protein